MAYVDDIGLSEIWGKISDLNDWMPKTAGAHNSIYRGKDITNKLNDGSLWESISSGTFDDVFVGDYFIAPIKYVTGSQSTGGQAVSRASIATNTVCRIMDIDRYLYLGNESPAFNSHHIVVVPDCVIGTCMADQHFGEVVRPFALSELYTLIMPAVNTSLEEVLSTHLLSKNFSLVNSIQQTTSGATISGGALDAAYYTCKALPLSELEVFGQYVVTSLGNTRYRYETGIDYSQLAGFKFNSNLVRGKTSANVSTSYWLRNTCAVDSNYTYFSTVQADGRPQAYGGQNTAGIRVKFLLG